MQCSTLTEVVVCFVRRGDCNLFSKPKKTTAGKHLNGHANHSGHKPFLLIAFWTTSAIGTDLFDPRSDGSNLSNLNPQRPLVYTHEMVAATKNVT